MINKVNAQEEVADVENIFKVNYFLPGVSYETRIAKKQTLYTEAFLAYNFSFNYSLYDGVALRHRLYLCLI